MGRPRKKLLPSADMSSFGIWLVTEMNESQLHLLDIVEQVGISYSVVYSWIRGDSNPRLVNLIEVCDVMSQQTNKPPFDLLSTAILCFPEAVYAQKRWAKRTRGKVREQNLVNGSSLYARMPSTDERKYFVPLDKTLESDRRAGDLTPDMTDAESDAVECVIKSENGVTCIDHDFFSLTTNKNCNCR